MQICKGDFIDTPRFLRVRIQQVFPSVDDLRDAGYTEPTYFVDDIYEVGGKSLGHNEMVFAAAYKVAKPVRFGCRCPACGNAVFVRKRYNYCGAPACTCTACGKLHEVRNLSICMESVGEDDEE